MVLALAPTPPAAARHPKNSCDSDSCMYAWHSGARVHSIRQQLCFPGQKFFFEVFCVFCHKALAFGNHGKKRISKHMRRWKWPNFHTPPNSLKVNVINFSDQSIQFIHHTYPYAYRLRTSLGSLCPVCKHESLNSRTCLWQLSPSTKPSKTFAFGTGSGQGLVPRWILENLA